MLRYNNSKDLQSVHDSEIRKACYISITSGVLRNKERLETNAAKLHFRIKLMNFRRNTFIVIYLKPFLFLLR